MGFYVGIFKVPEIVRFVAQETPGRVWTESTRTYIYAVGSRKVAEGVARWAARHAPGRVWIEDRQTASGRGEIPIAAELIDVFELTPEEATRLQVGPFRDHDGKASVAFALLVQEQVLKAYAEGEITLERALAVSLSCSLGCRPLMRSALLALTARRAIQNPPPRGRRGKRQPSPTWVRSSAASLVQMFHEDRPDEAFAPNDMNGWTTPILEEATQWLVTLGLCQPIEPRTLYKWYLAQKKEAATTPPPAAGPILPRSPVP